MTTQDLAIDAHAHVFRRGLPLAPGRRYAPDYDAPIDVYLRKLDENGLTHGLLVQPSFLGSDNTFLVESLRRAPERLRGVAVVDPAVGRDGLQRLNEAGIVGIRLNLVGRSVPDLGTDGWPMLLGAVGELGWHVEVQRRAADLPDLVARLLATDVTVVVDHYGLPDPGLGAFEPGWRAFLRLARNRRLWVKLSAVYRSDPAGESLVREFYPQLRDAFGLDRLMWGSDWPHTQFESTQSYETSRTSLTDLVDDEDDEATILRSPQPLFRLRA